MLGNVAPVVLRLVPPARDLLARPDTPRRSLHVGVLVTDPVDRPGRGALLLDGLRLGLDAARDLDAVITARGSAPFGPALLDAAAGLLEGGADFLVVTSTGVAGLVGPLCATRGVGLVVADEGDRVEHPVEHRPGVLRRTERTWQEAYVLGQWSGQHLDGGLFQLVTHEEEAGDAVLALRAGFTEAGGHVTGSVEVWPKSASAGALVARVSGARVIAVHATGHQLHEIVGALHAARVRPTSWWSVVAWTSGRWSTWDGAARCTPPRPGTARTYPTSSSPSNAAREHRPTRSPPSATTWPGCSSTPRVTTETCAPPTRTAGWWCVAPPPDVPRSWPDEPLPSTPPTWPPPSPTPPQPCPGTPDPGHGARSPSGPPSGLASRP